MLWFSKPTHLGVTGPYNLMFEALSGDHLPHVIGEIPDTNKHSLQCVKINLRQQIIL